MQDDVDQRTIGTRQPRRAEGDPAHGEPQLILTARIRRFSSCRAARQNRPVARCAVDRFRQSHFDRPLFDAGESWVICLFTSSYYGSDDAHAQRLYDYISNFGSCRPRLFSPMAARIAVCRFPAF